MIWLDDYLDQALDQPWRWGRMDCCMFSGEWILARTGHDPMGPYRGRYHNARGALRLIRARGGLVAMTAAEMLRCGFEETTAPERGDIGVVLRPGPQAVAGAFVGIFDGRWWAGRTLTGIAGVLAEPARCWRVAA